MKRIDEMTKDEINLLEQVKGYKVVTDHQVRIIEGFIRTYIDSSCTVCANCPAQIRMAYQRLVKWIDGNADAIANQLRSFDVRTCAQCNEPLEPKKKKFCSRTCKDQSQKIKRDGE